MELHANFLAEFSFVSRCCQDLWAIKKRRYGRFHPVKNAVENPPEVTRSDKLRCNRATSCFSIIGLSYSDCENHKTVPYFQESYSNGTDGNNGCNVQWQRHKV